MVKWKWLAKFIFWRNSRFDVWLFSYLHEIVRLLLCLLFVTTGDGRCHILGEKKYRLFHRIPFFKGKNDAIVSTCILMWKNGTSVFECLVRLSFCNSLLSILFLLYKFNTISVDRTLAIGQNFSIDEESSTRTDLKSCKISLSNI